MTQDRYKIKSGPIGNFTLYSFSIYDEVMIVRNTKHFYVDDHGRTIGWGFWRYDITTADIDNLKSRESLAMFMAA